MVYELPEFYKALALAYEKASVDESWRIAHSRLNDLVGRIERVLRRAEILGLELEGYIKVYGVRLVRGVEGGDVASVIDVYLELDRVLRQLESRITIAYVHLILGRFTSAIIVIGVSLILVVNSLRLGLLIPTTFSMIAAGVGVGSLLLVLRSNAHLVLLGAVTLQLLCIPIYAIHKPQDIVVLLTATLLSLASTSTLLILHAMTRRAVYSEVRDKLSLHS